MPRLTSVNNPADATVAARLRNFMVLASRTIDPGATQPRRSRTTEPRSLCLDSRSSNTVQVSRLVAALRRATYGCGPAPEFDRLPLPRGYFLCFGRPYHAMQSVQQ